MSLRARLALLYTSIVGGILLLFGVAVYSAVRVSLVNEIDETLKSSASDILPNVFVDSDGELNVISSPTLEFSTDVLVQVWGRNNSLRAASRNVQGLNRPLDSVELQSAEPVFRDITLTTELGESHLRVLTVPLLLGDRLVGALQVGTSLAVVDATQQALLLVLVVGAVLSMSIAGVASWVSTQQALAPLESVTETALQITRADDLSRRIPYKGPPSDEVGQLINAFNQTLGRLENLFHTQRRFIADVGHELRTPLTVIKGNVDLMRRMNELDAESLDGIENEVDRLTRLVGDLLLLAQAESGKLPLQLHMLELDTLMLDVMQQMRVLAHERVQLKLGDIDQVLVCGDKDKIKQVMVNLIGNAINYTPAGGQVIVGVGKVDNMARITIQDNGPGIPPQDLPYIFERFYRGEKSRTRSRDGKGFGLGLSIAYWIVRNHGGTIEVDSRVGEGTTFHVYLPFSQEPCEEVAELNGKNG
ncbi:MAG: HAMP domain-containing sensor histidine kinase [Anaerolineales bacterium]|nr:HAMP domain-containing sensor histidine kinase [Anaerolineales bacterium]